MNGVRWVADRDGTAHAIAARGRALSAACGAKAPDERWAWPESARCPRCRELVEAPMVRR